MSSDKPFSQRLRQRLGLRRTDLAAFLPLDLKQKWHIQDEDDLDAVRAKSTWQVTKGLAKLATVDTQEWYFARVAFNIELEADLRELNLGGRLNRAVGEKRRKAERWLAKIDVELTRRLTAENLPVPPAAEIRASVERERALRGSPGEPGRTEHGPGPLEALIPTVHGYSWELTVESLLASDVYVPVGSTGRFLLGATRTRGRWAYAFTREDLLEAFQLATQPRWAGHAARMLGSTLVRRVHRASYDIGLLINPPARGDERAVVNTFGISALQVAVIASKSR
jgi:hypothetical protein